MLNALRNAILRFLRVPPEPQTPEGSAGSALVFRAAPNFYHWQLLEWLITHGGIALFVLIPYLALSRALLKSASTGKNPFAWSIFLALSAIILGILAAVLLITYLALRWNYELRWYIVTDRSLRIRRGVWFVEEMTMTFANVQEIRIKSGPLDKYLGIAHVEVSSAGGGSPGPHGSTMAHKAVFEGVANAEEIRDRIVERLRAYRDAGLGAKPLASEPSGERGELKAAQAVLAECRALHQSLSAPPK